jgi:hypothetical protein
LGKSHQSELKNGPRKRLKLNKLIGAGNRVTLESGAKFALTKQERRTRWINLML